MENRNFNFVNFVMFICPIIMWACLFAVLFIKDNTVDMYIIGFQVVLLCFQLGVGIYSIRKRKKQKFYEN